MSLDFTQVLREKHIRFLKKLLVYLDELENTMQLIQTYEEQTGDLSTFKEAKAEIVSGKDELSKETF